MSMSFKKNNLIKKMTIKYQILHKMQLLPLKKILCEKKNSIVLIKKKKIIFRHLFQENILN